MRGGRKKKVMASFFRGEHRFSPSRLSLRLPRLSAENPHAIRCDAVSLLTGTFFCVMTATESAPLTPMAVLPAAFAALNAYSVWF